MPSMAQRRAMALSALGVGGWAKKRSGGKSYGDRLADKHQRLVSEGKAEAGSSGFAKFASKEAWRLNSEPAHDEAVKAHDAAASAAGEYKSKDAAGYHSAQREAHEDAMDKIEKGEKPEKPGESRAYDEDQHVRDDRGRFAPK